MSSKNLIDAIDNFSEKIKGENVDSKNLIAAIDSLSDIIDNNIATKASVNNIADIIQNNMLTAEDVSTIVNNTVFNNTNTIGILNTSLVISNDQQ